MHCEAVRLLMLDDEPPVRAAVARLLRRHGYDVAFAGSCAEARRIAGTFPVGIIDLALGDCCGADLAAELLTAGTVERAVFHTGSARSAARDRAAKPGAVVEKGQVLDGLLAAVRGVLLG